MVCDIPDQSAKPKRKIGRPRTVSHNPDEMIKLGEEMLSWVIENDPIHLKEWYSINQGICYKDWKSIIQRAEFIPYYEQAISIVSMKYIDGTINNSIAQRFLRMYFRDLKEAEDELKKFEASLVKEDKPVDEKTEAHFKDLMTMLAKLQSERKIADNMVKNAEKSE